MSKRVALITGARRGIGFGIAKRLAQEGCDVAICAVAEAADAADAVRELERAGIKVLYCKADISSAPARQAMLEQIKERFGRLDVLVNNAGVAPNVRADLLDATEESFDRVLSINLKGPYFLTQLVARYMIEQKNANAAFAGCIVNIGSVSATIASINRGDYCISKAGVAMATALWAARLGEFDIPVYEIRPGIISTDMTAGVKERYDKLIAAGLLVQPRWGLPEDVAKAVAMIVRGDIAYSTGQVIYVDGGMNVRRL